MKKSHRLCAAAIKQLGEQKPESSTVREICERMGRKFEANYFDFDKDEFKDACGFEDFVWRTHLKTGVDYLEHKTTPNCCSPATELYWSM